MSNKKHPSSAARKRRAATKKDAIHEIAEVIEQSPALKTLMRLASQLPANSIRLVTSLARELLRLHTE